MNYKNKTVPMLIYRNILLLLGFLSGAVVAAQTQASAIVEIEELTENKVGVKLSAENKSVVNQPALTNFFEKLRALEKENDSQVRIVHIGDSHIQAGFFSGKNRDFLQEIFGNAGLGFTFPHRLARTNGIDEVRYSSSVPWKGKRNIFASATDSIGLSGFGLRTEDRNFAIKLNVEQEKYYFNTLKLITPQTGQMFTPAKALQPINFENYTTEKKIHRIKSGEALSIIAQKYGVSVRKIKAANGLRSDAIRAGAKLVIPVKTKKRLPIDRSAFELMGFDQVHNDLVLHSDEAMQSLWLLSNDKPEKFTLDGFILERDEPGIIYSSIGVNGARFKDYNQTPLFFEQLKKLQPDLLVISLGTNEAHDNLKTEKFKKKVAEFLANLRETQPNTPILFTTPPPSLLKRRYPNTFSESYAEMLVEDAEEENFAVWNLFEALGGKNQVKQNYHKGLVSRDYVHYSKEGYTYSANLFTEALMNAFYLYLQNKEN